MIVVPNKKRGQRGTPAYPQHGLVRQVKRQPKPAPAKRENRVNRSRSTRGY